MSSIISWILDNYQWLFSGVGVFVVGCIATWRAKKNKQDKNVSIAPIMHQTQNVVVNVDDIKNRADFTNQSLPSGDIKAKTHILFIDDEDFTVVKLLKNAGWSNTKLKKKISNLDDPAIVDAHIVFVDIVGVCGDLFKDEGLGLARALKDKYNDKKIIIYSSESQGDRFNRTLRLVDECLPKNAEFYEFLRIVDQFAQEIWKND